MKKLCLLFCLASGLAQAQTETSPLMPTSGPAPQPTAQPASSPLATTDRNYVPDIAREAAADGNAAFVRHDYNEARSAYKKVLDLVPNNLLGLINLGVVEYASGHNAEAEKLLKQAIQIKLDVPPAWLTLGIIYMDQNRLNEALAALTQATLYDDHNARAHNYLGVVIGRKGWVDGAQAELRRAVDLDPSYSDAHYNLAAFYLESKPPSIELARRHYYRAIDLGAEHDPEMEKTLSADPSASPAPSPSSSPTAPLP